MSEETGITIENIAKAHPKNLKPIAAERAICQQLDRLTRKMTVGEALDYLMKRTKLYAQYVSRWPVSEFKYVPESQNWFMDGSFAAEEKLWEYRGDGKSTAQTKHEGQLDCIRQAAARIRDRSDGKDKK